jgi:hypothetical protein
MKRMGPPISRPRPAGEQVARAAGPDETSQMFTPALYMRAQPPCRTVIARRSRLPPNQDIVTALLHVFGGPARGVGQAWRQEWKRDRRCEQLSNTKRGVSKVEFALDSGSRRRRGVSHFFQHRFASNQKATGDANQ